jgi:tetratricopeptide (TPR) repeat protein
MPPPSPPQPDVKRPRAPFGVAFIGSVLLLALAAVLTPYWIFFGWTALGPPPGVEHADRAKELIAERRFSDALSELQLAIGEGYDNNYIQLDLAKCFEGLDRFGEASAAYDVAIGEGHWWPPYIEKANFLRRRFSAEEACDWLASLDQDPSDHKVPHLLGEFRHQHLGEPEQAIPHYEEAARRAQAVHGFRFDADGWLVIDDNSLGKENNDYADFWPTLQYLAKCRLQTGDLTGALHTATMGVAIGIQINRCKGYLGEHEVQAGNVPCRVVRAHVMIRTGRLDEAARELDRAQPLADWGGYRGHATAIAAARRELKAARAR